MKQGHSLLPCWCVRLWLWLPSCLKNEDLCGQASKSDFQPFTVGRISHEVEYQLRRFQVRHGDPGGADSFLILFKDHARPVVGPLEEDIRLLLGLSRAGHNSCGPCRPFFTALSRVPCVLLGAVGPVFSAWSGPCGAVFVFKCF